MRLTGSSNPYRWTTFLLATLLPVAAAADSGAYRIELLVFRYSDSDAEPGQVGELSDFPHAWRLFEPRRVILPEDPAPIGVSSDRMRSVWRRLQNDPGYEPLYQQTWEQSRIDYQPPVRIHDEVVLLQRLDLPAYPAYVDLTRADMLEPYRRTWYRLDGTAQLRHTRFLHLELDLEFRTELQAAEQADPAVAVAAASFTAPFLRAETAQEAPFWNPPDPLAEPQADPRPPVPGATLFRLRESRQIRTDELLYFDTPYLGVLARVTATAGE